MTIESVEFTFAIDDPDLDEYERQEFAKRLLKQLREEGDAETVERTEDLKLERGSKGGWDKLVGVLTAQVNFKNISSFAGFLGEKFGEKPMEIHVKVGDREVTIKGTGDKAVLKAKKIAEELIAGLAGDSA